ncbi:MAG TPA: DMT family transporter [Planctomycetes bacterium]|nr:DMT family transporter [Planctomycetota bacterium]
MRYVPVIIAVLVWSWSEVLIKYLQAARFDAYSQNFYRYGASALLMALWAAFTRPEKTVRGLKMWPRFFLPALFGTLYQTLWVIGFYRLAPAFAAIIGRSNIIVTIGVAVIFFPEERRLASDRRFLAATATALLAVSGVILLHRRGSEGAVVEAGFWWGVALVLIGSAMWVLYAFSVKRLVREVGPAVAFAGSSTIMSVFLFVIMLTAWGMGASEPGRLLDARIFDVAVLFGSGIICVGAAQSVYYKSIDLVGVSTSQIITLVSPLAVGVISYFMYGERLSVLQWCSGVALLASLAYIIDLDRRLSANAG